MLGVSKDSCEAEQLLQLSLNEPVREPRDKARSALCTLSGAFSVVYAFNLTGLFFVADTLQHDDFFF